MEFIPDESDPDTFYPVILESTPEDSKGNWLPIEGSARVQIIFLKPERWSSEYRVKRVYRMDVGKPN